MLSGLLAFLVIAAVMASAVALNGVFDRRERESLACVERDELGHAPGASDGLV